MTSTTTAAGRRETTHRDAPEHPPRETILTGDRPTGPLHHGHFAASLRNLVRLQQAPEPTLLLAGLQAFSGNAGRAAAVHRSVLEVALDYCAVGIGPPRTTSALQSAIPDISALMMLYLNLVTVARLERNPTVRSEIEMR